VFIGASSNSADRASFGGEGCVKLSTIDGAWFEVRLVGRAVLSSISAASKGRGFWGDGDSGENEGNEVSDLSEAAIEDAELDAYDGVLRDRTLVVCDLRLLVEISEC
jgi:hypothetical protein